jgi:hypothetical protein
LKKKQTADHDAARARRRLLGGTSSISAGVNIRQVVQLIPIKAFAALRVKAEIERLAAAKRERIMLQSDLTLERLLN